MKNCLLKPTIIVLFSLYHSDLIQLFAFFSLINPFITFIQELSTGERVELATEDKLENRELTQTEVENFFNIAKAKQKLESYAYTTGKYLKRCCGFKSK